MNIILMGPQGCGKGTQARILFDEKGMVQISTGDLFRENIKNETELGLKVKANMDAGILISDDITVAMLSNRLDKDDCKSGIILDGFPRTVAQAELLDGLLEEKGMRLDSVILIDIPDEDVIKRTNVRFTCFKCGEGYNDYFKKPSVENVCDKCGAVDSFSRRADDANEESVRTRLAAYHEQTAPILPFYEERGMLKKVDGTKSLDEVTSSIKVILG